MEKAKEVLLKGLQNISTTNLSQLLFDNKSEVACNQRLAVSINKISKDFIARVEYTNSKEGVSRADLVLISKESGLVELILEAKMLTAFNILAPTKGEKKSKKSHFLFKGLKKSITKHTSKQHKVTLMWVYGWNKNLDNPETHLKEKYFGGRNRKGMNYPLDKNEIKKKIKASYKEHKLGGGIKQEEFNAKDTHLSNNAFLIGTFATYK
tara:strand:+ start:304 stop:930 length:627 start_codon:yes stop_codon:yes gene_type:complete